MGSVELLVLDPKARGTKELIIRVLGNHWPLSAKEVHNCLARELGIGSTYQSTHKAIKELEDSGVIRRNTSKYQLDRAWIERSKNYFDNLHIAYEGKDYVVEGEKVIIFDNYTDFPMTLAHMFNSKKLVGPKHTDLYVSCRHLFWPLKFSFHDFQLCIDVGRNAKPRLVCGSNSPFDRLIRKYYGLAKWPQPVLGSDIESEEDVFVQGHTIVQVKYSEETKQKIDHIYHSVHNLADLFKQYLKHNTNDMQIEMKITQNPQLAGLVLNNIKHKYEGAL